MFSVEAFDVAKFDSILGRGLSNGLGRQGSQVCIEAAICETLGLPHGDDPGCVADSVRSFKISLNDSSWSSPKARAEGLRKLGLAQLGSKGVVDDIEFSKLLSERTIRILIPKLFRQIFSGNPKLIAAADRCEKEGTKEVARAAERAARAAGAAAWAAERAAERAARAAWEAAWAERAARAAGAAERAARAAGAAAWAAARAAAATDPDAYLILVADIALSVLIDLKSPGCALL